MKLKNIKEFKSKKGLKNYINQHGGFIKMQVNNIQNPSTNEFDKDAIPARFKDKVPEDAIYFEGIASNGDLNMNGYIIRASAWKPAINEYMTDFGWKIYYQHDMDKVIWQTLDAFVEWDELKVFGYVFDDMDTMGAIARGLSTDLSTGHYTLAREFQHVETGEVITEEEFNARVEETRTFEEFMKVINEWIMAVTELKWVEYSVVTVGSNRSSEITHMNSVLKYLWYEGTEEAMKLKFMESQTKETNEVKDIAIEANIEDTEVSSDKVLEVLEKTEENTEVEEETKVTVESEENSVEVETEIEEKKDAKEEVIETEESIEEVEEVVETTVKEDNNAEINEDNDETELVPEVADKPEEVEVKANESVSEDVKESKYIRDTEISPSAVEETENTCENPVGEKEENNIELNKAIWLLENAISLNAELVAKNSKLEEEVAYLSAWKEKASKFKFRNGLGFEAKKEDLFEKVDDNSLLGQITRAHNELNNK